MSTNAEPQATLAERVYTVLSEEHQPGSRQLALEYCGNEPHDGARTTIRESAIQDWCLTYGLAFGMLQSEAPEMDREQLALQALDAARAPLTVDGRGR